MSAMIDARRARPGTECEGCRYQARKGIRKHVQPAEYRCDNCDRPLCKPHINYEERGRWWLCARCLVIYERKRQRRPRGAV